MHNATHGKSLLASKTFWVNVITLAIGVIGVFAGNELIAENPRVVAGLITAIGVLNVFLRTITSEPIALSNEELGE